MWATNQACRIVILALLSTLTGFAQDVTEVDKGTRFKGYDGAPDIQVVSRKDDLFFYPCDQCHATMESNPEIRVLDTYHDAEIDHGDGQIWCHSCHHIQDLNKLTTLLDEPVDFDDAHLVCGGCHSNRHRDWTFGVHGKRVADWQGPRTQYDCAHCHNPHDPSIKARAPKPAPPVRAGLEREHRVEHEKRSIWESREEHENSE